MERNLVPILLGAKDGDAVLKVVFGATVGVHGLCLCVDGDLLTVVDGIYAHGWPKAHTVIMLGDCLAHASVNSMYGIVFKGSEDTKVVLTPVARNAKPCIFDVLEHCSHICKHAVAFGLPVPFVKEAHVSHVDRGDAPGAVAHCCQEGIGAQHKLTGAVEAGERVNALGNSALAVDFGYGEALVLKRPVDGA